MPLNVKSIYPNNTVKCHILQDTIEEVEQEDVDAADFVLTGPSKRNTMKYSTTVAYLGKFQERWKYLRDQLNQTVMIMRVKMTKKVMMVISPQENRKKQNKKTKDKKEEKPKWKKSHLKNLVVSEDVMSEKVSQKLLNMHPELYI